MNYDIYIIIRLVITSLIFFISIQMIVRPLPDPLKYGAYGVSRRIMGIAFMVLPVQAWVHYLTDLRHAAEYYTTAVNLSGYYISSALIHISLLALIDEKLNFRSTPFKIYVASFVAFPIFIFYGLEFVGINRTITTATTLLFSSIAGQFVYFFSRYNRGDKNRYYKYMREQRFHRVWINKSIYMLVILAIVACVAPPFFSYPVWLGLVFLFYVLAIYIYIFESYNRFILLHHAINRDRIKRKQPVLTIDEVATVAKADELDDETESETRAALSLEVCNQIVKELDSWLDQRGYCKAGLTIESVAADIKSNRTYLSAFVNVTYGCSFKNWITNLRLNYAKELMREDQKLTINDVSLKAGFSSQTSFIHVFKKSEELTPAKWRSNLKQL